MNIQNRNRMLRLAIYKKNPFKQTHSVLKSSKMSHLPVQLYLKLAAKKIWMNS